MDGGRPFDGRPGRCLASLAGMGLEGFLASVEAVNLLPRWPGRQTGGKGHLFPMHEARIAAERMLPRLRGRAVVLAGRRVALAFGLRGCTWLEAMPGALGALSVAVIPHPSGIVRWYNCPKNRHKVGLFLKELTHDI